MKIFALETIGQLLDVVNDKQEEEKILRSFFVHYDGYDSLMRDTKASDAFSGTQKAQQQLSLFEAKIRELYHRVQDEQRELEATPNPSLIQI